MANKFSSNYKVLGQHLLAVFFFFLLMTCSTSFAEQPSEKSPNVVLIFADDLGYGDLGCYGATKVKTPNIDRLAKEGRRFTDAHSVSAVCTPSRYALLTGQYPFRAKGPRGAKGIWGPAPIDSGLLVDKEKLTLADVFKKSGYSTAAFGKWHLGFKDGKNDWQEPLRSGPQDLGFDYYFGMPVVNSAPPYVYVENDRIVGNDPKNPLKFLGRNAKGVSPITPIPPKAAQRSANVFGGAPEAHKIFNDYQVGTTLAKKSVEWIKENKDNPFFLYLATTNIHHPFTPAKRFQGTSECGLYGDFIHELDWIVGEVMNCLEENGLSDNTLVIFTSDNGGMFNRGGQAAFKEGHRQNGDLLGFKFGVWEGGHRVPFIARWPGKVTAGTTSSQLLGNVDMLATFAALTKQSLEPDPKADSINMLPALVEDPEKPIRDHLILAPHKGTHLSVRKGKWMYIPRQGSGGFGGRKLGDHTFAGPAAASFVGSVNSDIDNGKIKKDAPKAQLYDLQTDRNQTKNVHDEYPDVVKELSAIVTPLTPKRSQPRKPNGGKAKNGNRKAAPKTDASPSKRSASFDFESGKLAPWKVVKGKSGHPLGSRSNFFRNEQSYNKQGKFYLTTLESDPKAERGSDSQTGMIISPLFIPKAGDMTFRVGGGRGKETYIALCSADGKELKKASGVNNQTMYLTRWDLTPFAGQKVFLKVVDQSTDGWGHITADNFQFDGKVTEEYPRDESIDVEEHESKEPLKANPEKNRTPSKEGSTQTAAKERSKNKKPNFVIIFTDDQGYGDLSCFGADHVSTPRIDQMATEGARLTSFYVAAPVCTPSRAALMTGCYPKRIGMATGDKFGVLLAGDRKGLNPDEITIAEVLKTAGYKTGMFGKWHLGDQPKFLPTNQGFDTFFGIPYSHDIHPFHPRQDHYNFPALPLLENETVIEMDPDADFLTKRITQRAVSFIEANKAEPFFLYVPHPIPHAPLHVSPPFMKGVDAEIVSKLDAEKDNIDYRTRDLIYRQAIAEIDWSVGKILDTLKANGLDENTLVLFTSDNGPPKNSVFASGGPLRGNKGTPFEGGVREPTVIRWPGIIPAGKDNDELMTTMDLLPTFAKLAGAELPEDRIIDGKDIHKTLTGKAKTPHDRFFYHRGNQLAAVRSGKWKLHINKQGKPTQLFDLEKDLNESQNVIKSNSDVVSRLNGYLTEFAKDIKSNSRPAAFVKNPKPLAIAKPNDKKKPQSKTSGEPSDSILPTTKPRKDKPNIVVIFADDLGYGDLSCYHADGVKTPVLDSLAADGFRCTDFFVPANVCSPSRAALLTGRYPMRCGIPVARHEKPNSKYSNYGLQADEITIPELLKPAGYRSLMVGKWHLGMEVKGSHPIDAGFDEHLGIPSNYGKNRGPNYNTLYRGKQVEQKNVACQALTKLYTDEAVQFIGRQKDDPFFIYVSHHIVHSPHLPSKEFVGTSKKKRYGDFIKELDHSTGRILKAIRDAGLDENTLVIFTSDNGPTFTGSSGGLNGGKYNTMEGGHRVPAIFHWPSKIPRGVVSDVTLTSMDLLPLCCEVAGAEQPADRKIDGKNILPVLQGEETKSPHEFLYYYNGTNLQAIRRGNWKLHLPRSVKDQPFWNKKKSKGRVFVTLAERQLFNLDTDLQEKKSVAEKHPSIVSDLMNQVKVIRTELGDVNIRGNDQKKINLVDPQVR